MELECKIQNYEWGKKGSYSKVATLHSYVNKGFEIDKNLPYAELWMGTHVNGPSLIKESGQLLSCLIANHPEYLGEEVFKSFKELPFLFKVLSVNKALSIQAHPSKKHAEELNAKYPNIYKDANHKPELAVALTHFEALCGFRPVSEIKAFIESIPQLRHIVDSHHGFDDTEFLKQSFKSVLTCEKKQIQAVINDMVKSFKTLEENTRNILLADLVEKLHSQFPYDNGILMVYFLNHLQLKPLEAIYLGANEPHAYLFGDCVEIMACSDNVVRAGLTPKFIDINTLCLMLIYKGERSNEKIYKPIKEDSYTCIYKPPVPDFALVQMVIPTSAASYKTIKRKSASIILVVEGSCQTTTVHLKPGLILFLPANEQLTFEEIYEDLLIFQGTANIS